MFKYLTTDLEKQESFMGQNISGWWSRMYEYPWAAQFAEKDDSCMDAGAGHNHPFKYYLAENCKEVRVIDLREDTLLNCNGKYDNLTCYLESMTDIKNEDNTFDKLYCISVIEHLKREDYYKSISEFYRVLKPGGTLVLTIDVLLDGSGIKRYLWLNEAEFEKSLRDAGFKVFSPVPSRPDNMAVHKGKNICVLLGAVTK